MMRTAGPARRADSTRSYHLDQVREHLQAASAEPVHPRDWRPQVLVFSNDPDRHGQLLALASWIQGGKNTLSVVQMKIRLT